MSTNMAWLAALLKPRDVAVHANFASEEVVDTPSVLALLALGELHHFARLTQPDPFRPDSHQAPWTPPTRIEADLLAFMQSAVTVGEVESGATGLRDLCASDLVTDDAAMTAAALVASVAFAESDDYQSSVGVLDLATERLARTGEEARLCEAALLLQRSLRVSDSGLDDGLEEARAAYRLLEKVDLKPMASFRVSLGVGWTSSKTMKDMHQFLLDSGRQALTLSPLQSPPAHDVDYFSWQDQVRSEPDHVSLLNSARSAHGYEKFIAALYKLETTGTQSREIVFGEVDRGQNHLFAAQFADEVSGRRSARTSRRHLAEYRYLLARADGAEPADVADVLRLLRHSGSPESLKSALNLIRAEGPLLALERDATAICRQRLHLSLLREPEFRVLHVAADVLRDDVAGEALDVVLSSIDSGVPAVVPGRWSSRAARLEPAWLAAGALAASSGRSTETARHLLAFVKRESQEDVLLDRALARAMRELDWETVDAATADAWIEWAMDGDSEHRAVREQAVASVGADAPVTLDSSSPTLGEIAQGLNIRFRGGEFPAHWLSDAVATVRQDLVATARNAEAGMFSGGGIATADVAVGLAVYLELDELWPDIASFLTHAAVQRSDTSDALDRMAVEAAKVPGSVVDSLRAAKGQLLFSSTDAFGPSIDPYPAALRCLWGIGAVESDELLVLCTRLAGGGSTGRHEAARVVTSACRKAHPPDWLRVTALHLSWDSLPEVRAEAARALALLSHAPSADPALFEGRLIALLNEDGLLVPIMALKGLLDLGESLGPRVVDRVSALAASHASLNVRRLARSLSELSAREES